MTAEVGAFTMYEHTQYGPWHMLFLAIGGGMLYSAYWAYQQNSPAIYGLVFGGVLLCLAAFAFQSLTIRDEGDVLAVRFGPLPLIGTRIRYADIESVQKGRTTFFDGWGLHWSPGRGWVMNIWGFDCVELKVKSRGTIRLGTDEPEALCNFLRLKLAMFAATSSARALS